LVAQHLLVRVVAAVAGWLMRIRAIVRTRRAMVMVCMPGEGPSRPLASLACLRHLLRWMCGWDGRLYACRHMTQRPKFADER
jgi:hypothetical protein